MAYQFLFSNIVREEKPIDSLTEISYDDIRAGDTIGYVLTKKFPEQVWINAYVIGVDRDPKSEGTVAIVQEPSGSVSTLHSSCDSIARWED